MEFKPFLCSSPYTVYPITAANMNYNSLGTGLVLLATLAVYYCPVVGGVHWFTGPRPNLGQVRRERNYVHTSADWKCTCFRLCIVSGMPLSRPNLGQVRGATRITDRSVRTCWGPLGPAQGHCARCAPCSLARNVTTVSILVACGWIGYFVPHLYS